MVGLNPIRKFVIHRDELLRSPVDEGLLFSDGEVIVKPVEGRHIKGWYKDMDEVKFELGVDDKVIEWLD